MKEKKRKNNRARSVEEKKEKRGKKKGRKEAVCGFHPMQKKGGEKGSGKETDR